MKKNNTNVVIGKLYVEKNYESGEILEVIKIYGKKFCRVKEIRTNKEKDMLIERLIELKK